MLSQSQFGNLTSLFTPQAVQEPLSHTLDRFGHLLGNKMEHFKVGAALLSLFQHDTTVSMRPEYRLLAIFFVLELYKSEPITQHPFLALIRRLLHRENSLRSEQPVPAPPSAGATPEMPAQQPTPLEFQYDIFYNSVMPVITEPERNILKSLILEKLGIKTQINRSSLMKKSIKLLLSTEYSAQLKCNITLDSSPLDIELAYRKERLTETVTSSIDSICINERRKCGLLYDLIVADEQWAREKQLNEMPEKTSVVNQALYDNWWHNTENLNSHAASRIFRPTVRYPPPPINFLIEDELAWLDLDETSAQIHSFDYDFEVEDNYTDFLELSTTANPIMANYQEKPEKKASQTSITRGSTPTSGNASPLPPTTNHAKDRPKTSKQASKDSTKELKLLLSQAMAQELSPDDVDVIRTKLDSLKSAKDPAKLGVLPSNLKLLVDKNALVAVSMLKHIATFTVGDKNNVKDYLRVLLDIKEGTQDLLHSMEVVNRLTSMVSLPTEFIHSYISACIEMVEKVKHDRTAQKRLVRLVCVFIRSLLTNKILVVSQNEEIIVEIQTFCVTFPKVKESVDLFRMLRNLCTDEKKDKA